MCIRPFLYLSLHQIEYLLLRRALLMLECAWWTAAHRTAAETQPRDRE